jgi:hypothetical protein
VPGATDWMPLVFAVAIAGVGIVSLRHAHKLMNLDDARRGPAWPWVVAGVILLGMAAGITASAMRPADGIDA